MHASYKEILLDTLIGTMVIYGLCALNINHSKYCCKSSPHIALRQCTFHIQDHTWYNLHSAFP